tara:strand:- start:686 stop:868 length:183 start_codon:yes stop_codon:yes gene_type:complete
LRAEIALATDTSPATTPIFSESTIDGPGIANAAAHACIAVDIARSATSVKKALLNIFSPN